MNAPFVPPPSAALFEPSGHDAATAAVAAWRGQMLQLFGRAEMSVSDTLLTLADAHGGKVKKQRLIGARYDDLAAALAASGVRPCAAGAAALHRFRDQDLMRHALCHGVASVYLDARGAWLALFRLLAFNGGNHEHRVQIVEEAEATRMLASLAKQVQDLNAILGQVRAQPVLQRKTMPA